MAARLVRVVRLDTAPGFVGRVCRALVEAIGARLRDGVWNGQEAIADGDAERAAHPMVGHAQRAGDTIAASLAAQTQPAGDTA